MNAVRKKYKDHKEEILAVVQVTNDLLALLTREGLLDIADCVRYQGMADMRRRTQAFLEMVVERSSERAYRVLIQGLRETGQSKAADMLTDAEEETNLIIQLQKLLDERIDSIDGFIQNEVDRVGVQKKSTAPTREKKPCGHPKQKAIEGSKVSKGAKEEDASQESKNKEIWRNAQESMRRAYEQLERCKLVIGKLHQDCFAATERNTSLTTQTRECYIQLSKMIRPSNNHGKEIQSGTQSPLELYQLVVDDVHRLMSRERKAQEREMEGRANAMRTLRQLRDWILDRSGILTSLHSTFRPLGNGNARFKSHHPSTIGHSSMMTSSSQHQAFPSNQRLVSPDRSDSLHFHEPVAVASIDTSTLPDNDSSIGGQKALLPVPFATSTPRPSDSDSRQHCLNIEPISTLVEGVNILEKQLREYIHLEILLTDKFRFEMRMKQHQQKAQGLTPQGINEARSIIGKLSTSHDSMEPDSIHKLRGQLERISMEYAECGKYMDKVISSMNQIGDVDDFLRTLNEREKQYKKDMNKPEKKSKGRTKNDEAKDSYTNLVEMFKTGQKNQHSKSSKSFNKSSSNVTREKVKLPSIRKPGLESKNPDDLLTKLKVLVANFEIVRLRMLTVEDRYRRDLARRERQFESILHSREDELCRLKTALNEAEAEKDKYLRLYNSTKISVSRKK